MTLRRLLVVVVLPAALLTGCADKRITLRYTPEGTPASLTGGKAITVFQFDDRRGSEGDDNDPLRVGGIYGGYGNRLSKVMVSSPFQHTLVTALTGAFQARGVQAVAAPDRRFTAGSRVDTPLALSGELKNFSTEARFTNSAHIGGIIRLYSPTGAVLVEKEISERERQDYGGAGVFTDIDVLEEALNKALAKFIRAVVTDPDITRQINGP